MKIRKHRGINQKTGTLKKGFKYQGRFKSGLAKIVKVKSKVKSKKGGGPGILRKRVGRFDVKKDYSDTPLTFSETVTIKKQPFNDCPREFRLTQHKIIDTEGQMKKWMCNEGYNEYMTPNNIPCCKKRFKVFFDDEPGESKDTIAKSKLRKPHKLKKKATQGFLQNIKQSKLEPSLKIKIKNDLIKHIKQKTKDAQKKVINKVEHRRPRRNKFHHKVSPLKSLVKAKQLEKEFNK